MLSIVLHCKMCASAQDFVGTGYILCQMSFGAVGSVPFFFGRGRCMFLRCQLFVFLEKLGLLC